MTKVLTAYAPASKTGMKTHFLNFAKKAFTNLQINIPIHILLTGQAISELFAKV